MSIQQSVNQAISGSLYLLGQSTLFRTLKEERDLKVQKERLEKEAKLNAPRDKGINTPQPQEQDALNESDVPGKQNAGREESTPEDEYPYLRQIKEFNLKKLLDLKKHLESRVAESTRAEQLSREFRGQLTGRGDTLG